MATCALLIAIIWIPETHTPEPHTSGQPRLNLKQRWLALPFRSVFLLLITFGVTLAWSFIEPQFMFYTYENLSWTSAQLRMVMSAYGVAFMSGEFILGQLSDRLGRKSVAQIPLSYSTYTYGYSWSIRR